MPWHTIATYCYDGNSSSLVRHSSLNIFARIYCYFSEEWTFLPWAFYQREGSSFKIQFSRTVFYMYMISYVPIHFRPKMILVKFYRVRLVITLRTSYGIDWGINSGLLVVSLANRSKRNGALHGRNAWRLFMYLPAPLLGNGYVLEYMPLTSLDHDLWM